MTAALFNLDFEQGIGREVMVSSWKNRAGEFYDLRGFRAHLSLRKSIDDDAILFDKTTENGQVVVRVGTNTDATTGIETITGNQIIATFTDVEAETMVGLPGARCDTRHPQLPRFKSGVWEFRVYSPSGRAVSVVRGETRITLAVVRV